jgi:transposase-like protein
VTLKVPKLRKLPFETAIIERYRRREASVEESLVEMYLAGVSVRRVEDITEALWGTRVSSSTVSRLNQTIYRHIEAWRNRTIEGDFPYVYLDGVVLKRSWAGEVRNISVLVAIGVGERIIREIRRRTRVVGAFPDGHSALMLVAARLRHIASTRWGKRRYLAMETLLNPVHQEAAA